MDKFIRTCKWCYTQFETEWETKTYCSRSHKEQARENRKRIRNGTPKPVYERTCIGCATEYTTTRKDKTYCSDECRQWQKYQMRRTRDRDYQNARTPSFKARIYWRNNGICALCNQSIDTTLKYPNPKSFSIDHIIPRSQGGLHKIDNLQAAHLDCNASRGNKPLNNS